MTEMESNDDVAVLIERARGGSIEALGELIDTVRTYLLLVANQETDLNIQAKIAASDIVQDACLLAHQRFETFRGTTEAELRGWMRRVLLHSISDSRKKFVQSKKRQLSKEVATSDEMPLASPELTPNSAMIAREEADLLRSAMEQLSAEHREVLRLRNWELLPFAEIGKKMNRSDDAAQKLWSRAVRELEKILEA